MVMANPMRLGQALNNMLRNAVEALANHPEGRVEVELAREGREARLTVSDNGPGIPEEELPHVFERFHRGKQERATTSGAGLGLSIARELTELLGGQISATSPDGAGATFTVTLPREASRRGATAPAVS